MKKKAIIILFTAVVMLTTLACGLPNLKQFLPTPTQTPTLPPTGTNETTLPDGSVVFSDFDNQYEVTFPEAWTIISLEKDDLDKIMDKVMETNPGMENVVSMVKNMDPNIFRIFAFDFRPEHIIDGASSSINILVQNDNAVFRMPLKNLIDMNVASLPSQLPGATLIDSKVTTSGSGLGIGVIEVSMPMTTSTGKQITLYDKMVHVKVGPRAVLMTFGCPSSLQEVMLPEFDKIIDSFTILE
jgi:hypothetical protein